MLDSSINLYKYNKDLNVVSSNYNKSSWHKNKNHNKLNYKKHSYIIKNNNYNYKIVN